MSTAADVISAVPGFHAADFEFAQDLLEGNDAAWRRFNAEYAPAVLTRLRGMGASDADAGEALALVIEKLWSRQKLASYSGSGPLLGFVRAAASNAWLEYMRKHRREIPASSLAGDDEDDPMDRLADPGDAPAAPQETPLGELLRDALRHALGRADPEALLILRLSLLMDIKQRDLCAVWGGMHEGSISNKKKGVMQQIRSDTLDWIAEREPTLQITWQELLEACGDGADAILGPSE